MLYNESLNTPLHVYVHINMSFEDVLHKLTQLTAI